MPNNEWKDITDPEELFRLKREGWEIQIQSDAGDDIYCPFKAWDGQHWNTGYLFRARPRQPKMKKVKMLCWYRPGYLLSWVEAYMDKSPNYIRVPSEDIEIEVPDEQ